MSDMVSSAFGSLAMMTSVLVSPDGYYEYEAAHGTVQRHYYKRRKAKRRPPTPWQPSLHGPERLESAEIDENKELMEFADRLEKATIDTIEEGKMTKRFALITTLPESGCIKQRRVSSKR